MAKYTLDSYYTLGDTYLVLYSEFIYVKNFINKIGDKARYEQITSLQEELEKVKNSKKIVKILMSMYYLLLDFTAAQHEDTDKKFIQFSLMQKHAKSLNSPLVFNCILQELLKF
jgi:hypothetical protein